MRRAVSRLWKSYFNFTKGERNAAVILIVLILLTTVYPWVDEYFYTPEKVDFSEFRAYAAAVQNDTSEELTEEPRHPYSGEKREPVFTKFRFDPNTVSAGDLKVLGFRSYIAERIEKYRSSGGKFRFKNDLSKIYGIDTVLVKQLWNYIELPEKTAYNNIQSAPWARQEKPAKAPLLIDINTADTSALVLLPGIGSKLARRIVEFREKLGGFYSLAQLNEVYGLKPETVTMILPRLQITISSLNFIDINTADFAMLDRHPYIDRNQATAIINYRRQHGNFRSLEDLGKIVLIDELTLNRLKNYIKF